MSRRKRMVTFAIEPVLLEQIEAWIKEQSPTITKTAVFEAALSDWITAQYKWDAVARINKLPT